MATRRPKVPHAQHNSGTKTEPAPLTADTQDGAAPTRQRKEHRMPVSSAETARGHGKPQNSRSGQSRPGGSTKNNGTGPGKSEGVIRSDTDGVVPARTFNGRLVVIGVAMAALTLILAPNVHTFLEQRAEISALQADIDVKTSQQSTFKTELARWDDPEYVKQQARDRVSMLLPGETGYWVYGANASTSDAGNTGAAGSPGAVDLSANNATTVTDKPWVDGLWQSIQKSADAQVTPAPAVPAPAVPAPAEQPPAAGN